MQEYTRHVPLFMELTTEEWREMNSEQVNERMSIISGGSKCAKNRKCNDVIKSHRESR